MTLQKLRDFLVANISCKDRMVEFIESIEVTDYDYGEDRVVRVLRVNVDTFVLTVYSSGDEFTTTSVCRHEELDHFRISIVCQAEVMEYACVSFTLDDGEVVELIVEDIELFDNGECLCTVMAPVK